jgi:hypothetical protein
MPTYEDLLELAKICTRQARAAADKSVATVLLEMAKEYQAEALKIDSSKSRKLVSRYSSSEGY